MNETILIIGAARSGLAAARLAKKAGYEVILTDLKKVQEKEELQRLGITVYDEGHPDFLRQRYAFVVKNPGIPYHNDFIQYFVQNQIPIYTEIDLACRLAENFHYGAITGTDGKTTITTLLHHMLLKKDQKAKAAGNIGLPLSELVLEENKDIDVALELSNFQLLGMEHFRADAAAISNLAEDHLDYMDSLEDYYRSKFKILQNMTEKDVFILNLDDPLIPKYFKEINTPAEIWTITLDPEKEADIYLQNGRIYIKEKVLFDQNRLHLVGSFNLMNAMMAAALAFKLGVSPAQIEEAIDEFHGVEHRIEYLGKIGDVLIYNDSKSTSAHSTQAALSAFDQPVYLLCGGFNKGISYEGLKALDDQVKHCFSFGTIRDQFAGIFSRQESFETMEQALDAALKLAGKGDVILLSPATSSFDQFENYEKRGEFFKKLIEERRAHG